jgi:hypothetical protein
MMTWDNSDRMALSRFADHVQDLVLEQKLSNLKLDTVNTQLRWVFEELQALREDVRTERQKASGT